MTSRKKQCPRQAQMHRHCLDSLEIPYSRRCIVPRPFVCQIQPPTCQVPSRECQTQSRACQVTPPACQIKPLNCQNPDPSRQVQPPACQVKHPNCQTRLPACNIIPRLCHQLSPPCQVIPSTWQVTPQEPFPPPRICQLPPPTFQNQPPTAMEHPICQRNQDFCPVGTCRSSTNCGTNRQSPHTFCHNYSNEDVNEVMYSDCFGPCTHQKSGCENVEENDLDQILDPYLNEANTSNTNQNANTTSSYRNNEEISAQIQNIPHIECVESCQNECFSAAGTSNTEVISNADNLNNASVRTNFRKTGGFSANGGYHDRNKTPIDINASHLLRSQALSQDINKIPDCEIPSHRENSPQISDNSDRSNMWETTPCCRPGYFQEQALQPNFSTGNEAHCVPTEVAQNTSTTRKLSMSFQSEKCLSVSPANEPLETNSNISPADAQHICGTSFDEMTPYRTRTNIDNINNDEFQEHQTGSSKDSLHSLPQFSKDKNMNGDKHFEQNTCCDGTKEKVPHIVASPCPRSALKSLSSFRPKSSAKVHMRESSNGTYMDCDTCCDVFDSRPNDNLQENFPPEYGKDSQLQSSEHTESQTRFANRSHQSIFENSVPMRGPKQFANCCDRGISGVLTEPPEDIDTKNNTNKDVACVQEFAASSHALPTCDTNMTVFGCECRYPPAFKQLSCAGNINGTCDCSDKSKI